MKKIEWKDLLCMDTLAPEEKPPASWRDYDDNPFEEDYREIISSVSFRHLQDKTQVYMLMSGDFVRTRLTHSLEVSTHAKQLGIMIIYNNRWRDNPALKAIPEDMRHMVPTVLACSGLLHDMGNPPYGHEGEAALGRWFEEKLKDDSFCFRGTPIRELFSEEMCCDLMHYEGNAQVIRMLSKARFDNQEDREANVSFATISTLIKYPVSAREMDKNAKDLRLHKFGYFNSEKELVKEIRKRTGIDLPEQPYARNPLTYLLEAADDISYSTSDIEDAVDRGNLTVPQIVDFIERELKKLPKDGDEKHQLRVLTTEGMLNKLVSCIEASNKTQSGLVTALHQWTTYMKKWFMYVASRSFVDNIDSILDGSYQDDLLEGSMHRYTIDILKRLMVKNVYPQLSVNAISAFTVLSTLVDRFASAAIYWDTDRPLSFGDRLHMQIIPQKFKDSYMREKGEDENYNLYLRFRMVIDFLISLTDSSAFDLYQRVNAMKR